MRRRGQEVRKTEEEGRGDRLRGRSGWEVKVRRKKESRREMRKMSTIKDDGGDENDEDGGGRKW